MVDELVQLPNPDNVPGAVSTGYQRQNVNLLAGQTGLDLTAPYVSGATIVLPVGGIIDVNGVLYKIEAEAILTPANLTDAWYIYLEVGTGTAFTPKLTTNPGTFNAAKTRDILPVMSEFLIGYILTDYTRLIRLMAHGTSRRAVQSLRKIGILSGAPVLFRGGGILMAKVYIIM